MALGEMLVRNHLDIYTYNAVSKEREHVYVPFLYQMRPIEKGFKGWLQKKLLHVLMKMSVVKQHFDTYESINVQRVTIDIDNLHDTLMSYYERTVATFGVNIEKVLVGYDIFNRLTKQAATHPFSFTLEPSYTYGRPSFFIGIPIQVVPWIDGVVFVPKEEH